MNRRQRIRDKLENARELVRTYFDPPNCTWDGRFHSDRRECRDCIDGEVCAWVFAQDPDPDLGAFAPAELEAALVFATAYLEGHMYAAGHEPECCRCDICGWVREAHAATGGDEAESD